VPVAIMTIMVRQSFQKQQTSLKKWFLQLDLVPVIVFACRETGNGEEFFFLFQMEKGEYHWSQSSMSEQICHKINLI